MLIDGLKELADHEGNRLDPLDLLLSVQVLLLQVPNQRNTFHTFELIKTDFLLLEFGKFYQRLETFPSHFFFYIFADNEEAGS